AIAFGEAALGVAREDVALLGNGEAGYTLLLNTHAPAVPFVEIAATLDSIVELSAELRLPLVDNNYDFGLQTLPPTIVLTGGRDAVVPEPTTAATAMLLLTATALRRPSRHD
ncbi:MAG: hypothetical protein AAF266_16575, partial [Planctomycetota bacterium]